MCDELGIVYVAPLRIDDRVKVTERTRDCLRIAIAGEPHDGKNTLRPRGIGRRKENPKC
jgi:hypothetical protein